MAQRALLEEDGVRFGAANGVLFVLTAAAAHVPASYGVGLLLAATGFVAVAVDLPYALGLGLAGWAFATGFSVHTLGVLTFDPADVRRLVVFLVVAAATSHLPFGDRKRAERRPPTRRRAEWVPRHSPLRGEEDRWFR